MAHCHIFPTFILLWLTEIYCHGDTGPKLLLISFDTKLAENIFSNIPITSRSILLSLNISSQRNDYDMNSIINGCYPGNTNECEPIWVTNQNNNHESAIMNWPNQLMYKNIWPTFSFGCQSNVIPLNLQLKRMLNWMSRSKTTLGIMFVDNNFKSDFKEKIFSEFCSNVSKQASHHNFNVIFISVNSTKPIFLAYGPGFISVDKSIRSINIVDINLVISNILRLESVNSHSDANATLVSLLTKNSNTHFDFTIEKLIIFAGMIGLSLVISCIIFIGAVKSRGSKLPKLNHQYNLGLTTTSHATGFPENAYLLNASDEDELFSDALPHIQTSRQQ